jgi:hypothetical protein
MHLRDRGTSLSYVVAPISTQLLDVSSSGFTPQFTQRRLTSRIIRSRVIAIPFPFDRLIATSGNFHATSSLQRANCDFSVSEAYWH